MDERQAAKMTGKLASWLKWILFGWVIAGPFIYVPIFLGITGIGVHLLDLAPKLSWILLPSIFAVVGVLIISRQPKNVTGLLLMVPAILGVFLVPIDLYMMSLDAPPSSPGPLFLVMTWLAGWSWVMLMFPLFLIFVYFPTGKVLPGRWKLVPWLALTLALIFIFLSTFSEYFTDPDSNRWRVKNPIGFISEEMVEVFIGPWFLALMVLALLSFASLFIRYRRARAVEREQIKLLMFACSLFASIFVVALVLGLSDSQGLLNTIWDIVFWLSMVSLPVSIGIAILKHHLWDIDIIIRRTLLYALLTGTVGILYLSLVTLLQGLFTSFTGQTSPAAIVLSTLGIAALFNTLRGRIQQFIDRRFYRQKYDAERALSEFAAAARQETDLEELTRQVVGIVEQTLQPEQISLWLLMGPDSIRRPDEL
jgi:hypothetical protein